jgi:hypothetical protein
VEDVRQDRNGGQWSTARVLTAANLCVVAQAHDEMQQLKKKILLFC